MLTNTIEAGQMTILTDILSGSITGISEHIEDINSGGCGWYAYQLQDALASHDISSDVVLIECGYYGKGGVKRLISKCEAEDISQAYINKFLNSINRGGDPCNGHVGLLVDGVIYDSDGVNCREAISEGISREAMALFLNAPCTWNPVFLYNNEDTVLDDMLSYMRAALAPLTYTLAEI